jgi:hypothetical protein
MEWLILSFSASLAGPFPSPQGPLRRGATAPILSPLYPANQLLKFGFENLHRQTGVPCFSSRPLMLLAHFGGI